MSSESLTTLFLMLVFVAYIQALFLTSRRGWRSLAETYPREAPHGGSGGKVFRFQSVSFGHMGHYNGIVRVEISDEGLGLTLLFPFRPFHRPLWLPWSQMKIKPHRHLLIYNGAKIEVASPARDFVLIGKAAAALLESQPAKPLRSDA